MTTMRSKLFLCGLLSMTISMTGLTCPDDCEPGQPNPAAVRIDFNLLSQTSDTTGMVEIVGVVENIGSGNFDSSAGQQSIRLVEGTTEVAAEVFEDLAVGETVTVSFTRAWDTSNEFPPVYRLTINYDPDIFIDGNPANDDCATSDNATQRDGSEINDLF